ncbi:hypothetical protein AGMMS50239_38590 [Bacteroidia bacterium]|nr:hypothetical protein AGMMS50239_38590 [Bacteroidia bacterium]GHV31270.1 hypothetical protein FACS1894177_05480 [Bacteroidia bacterium]
MKTKETKEALKSVSKEETGRPKKLNALGEWFYDPNKKPFIKIIDMRAVLR